MDITPYATVQEANEYFNTRLYSTVWFDASDDTKLTALKTATRAIDSLNYKGSKLDELQELEFPRDYQEALLDEIKIACCEEALERLNGKDPQKEIENLMVSSEAFVGVKVSYTRSNVPESLRAGFMSSAAWSILRPHLKDSNAVLLSRVS